MWEKTILQNFTGANFRFTNHPTPTFASFKYICNPNFDPKLVEMTSLKIL
jgi:hypothetical protein